MVTLTKELSEVQALSLDRARNGTSLTNYPIIIAGFSAMGISEYEIKPRFNVFTYQAWKALGRQVRKGSHGVKVFTFVKLSKQVEDKQTGEKKEKSVSVPRQTTVFHISQTDDRSA